jgi:hypothetical protein
MDDTFSASDFSSAESASSEPAAGSASVESLAPVDTTAQPDGATTQPAVATTDQPLSTEPAKAGPIPFDVHKTALENARQKAVAEWEQQYGWAKQIPPQDFQQAVTLAKRAHADPIGYLQDFIKDLQSDPTYGAQLRSLAARALAQRTQQPEQEPQPDLPIQLEDGRVVHLYSAEQQAKREAFLQKQWLASVQQELQPLKQSHEQQQRVAEQARQEAAWNTWQGQVVADTATWPGMDNPDVRSRFAADVWRQIQGHDVTLTDTDKIERAIERSYRTVVVPSLQTTSRQAVLNDINRQAAASTVNPAQTSTRAPKSMDEMSIAEALQHVAAQQGA